MSKEAKFDSVSERLLTNKEVVMSDNKVADTTEFKALIDPYYAAWSYENGPGGFERAAKFYAKEPGLVFYDPLPPVEGHFGWEAIKAGVEKFWTEAGITSALISRTAEPQVWRYGQVAWAAVPHQAVVTLQNGQTQTVEQRQTFVWEKRGNEWQIVHEHASAAVQLGSKLENRVGYQTPVGRTITELKSLVKDFWAAWSTRNVQNAFHFYATDSSLVVYLPWRTAGYQGWNEFSQTASAIVNDLKVAKFTPHDDIWTQQWGDIAVTAGIFTVDLLAFDGSSTQGDARYTLIWAKRNGKWLILHDHLSAVLSTNK